MNGRKDAAMHNRSLLFPLVSFLTASCALCGVSAIAATPFAITATNFTWSSAGPNSSQYTVTGIPADGTIVINCIYAGTATAKYPICGGGPVAQVPVTAGQTLTGVIGFQAWGTPVPVSLPRTPHHSEYLPIAGVSLVGVFMAGLGRRRELRRWIAMVVLAMGALTGLAEISACGGTNPFAMTPGTYPYTISAVFQETGSNVPQPVSTTISVAVP
ncbi:MAG: hypothetical protein ABSD72_12115 [Terracidiphilus sp.]|jgi:hypothetical protein